MIHGKWPKKPKKEPKSKKKDRKNKNIKKQWVDATPVKAKSGSSSSKGIVKYVSGLGKKKTCHVDPCEVIPGLWLGSYRAESKFLQVCSTIVPLNDAVDVWSSGWRGDILYVPIRDYKALPDDVLSKYVGIVVEKLTAGEHVGIYCLGGHGRTGYFAAAVLWALGIPQLAGKEPIEYLRAHYCKDAVESDEQVMSLVRYTGIKELSSKYKQYYFNYSYGTSGRFGSTRNKSYTYGYQWDEFDDRYMAATVDKPCGFTADIKEILDDTESPCYDCLHAEDIEKVTKSGKSEFVLRCDLGEDIGTLCVRYYPLNKDMYAHKDY